MFLTIFTPTYNRAYILPELFRSLQQQTSGDFEWLIVDDGSTDNTKDKAREFQELADFPVRYIFQENHGKHTAINLGVQNAKGELFFIVDSDDFLADKAVEILRNKYEIIKNSPQYSGIAVGCRSIKNEEKIIYSGKLPEENNMLTYNDLVFRLKITGDFATAFKTEIQKKYPYPVFENENFMRESIVYRRIGKKYKTLYIEDPIYFADYLDDGLTAKSWQMLKKNPLGASLFFKELSNENIPLTNRLSALNAYWDFQRNDVKSHFFTKFKGVSVILSLFVLLNKKLKLMKL